jgi:hypothetical protein
VNAVRAVANGKLAGSIAPTAVVRIAIPAVIATTARRGLCAWGGDHRN